MKSRLHEARKKLRQTLPLLHQGLEASPGADGPAMEGNLGLAELVDILNYANPGTESHIVDELERRDPEFAETIKQNMFVFEDFVLFDAKAIRVMVARVRERDLLLGLASTLTIRTPRASPCSRRAGS